MLPPGSQTIHSVWHTVVGTIISTLVKRPHILSVKGFASPSDTTNYVRAPAVFLMTLSLHHVGMTEHEVSPHRCVVLSSV